MKKCFIYGLIVSLVLTGLLGIWALLEGNFDELHIRILLTTFTFTVYSIIGLCCNAIVDSKYSIFGKIGLGVTIIGLLYAIFTTWVTPDSFKFLKFRFSLLTISLCFAHCSLMLLVSTYTSLIKFFRATSLSTSILAAVTIVSIISTLDPNIESFKLLGVISIVCVTSTIITPILAFATKRSNVSKEI